MGIDLSTKDVQQEAQKILSALSPENRNFARAVATMRAENKVLSQRLEALKAAHEDLWMILITIIDAFPEREMRIHKSQFLRFRHEYRLERTEDPKTDELVLKLLTLHD